MISRNIMGAISRYQDSFIFTMAVQVTRSGPARCRLGGGRPRRNAMFNRF
jgi:hypothetical protein